MPRVDWHVNDEPKVTIRKVYEDGTEQHWYDGIDFSDADTVIALAFGLAVLIAALGGFVVLLAWAYAIVQGAG